MAEKCKRKPNGRSIYIDDFRCAVNHPQMQNFHELFAFLVERRRRSLRLSQHTLADRIGTSRHAINYIETHPQAFSTRFFLNCTKLELLTALGYEYKLSNRVFEVFEAK